MADTDARCCRRNRAWNREQWRGHVAAQVATGLTIEDYCVSHGLKRRTFHRWRHRFNQEGQGVDGAGHKSKGLSQPAFAEVLLVAAHGPREESGIEVILGGARRLCVGPGFDEETLRRLVAVLESVPC